MSWTGVDWTAEYPRFLLDVTGDGRADIVGCGPTGTWVSRNDGHGNFLPPELAFNNLGYNQSWRVANHVRTTGNFAKVTPVIRIDDRPLTPGPLYARARKLYWDFAHATRLAA